MTRRTLSLSIACGASVLCLLAWAYMYLSVLGLELAQQESARVLIADGLVDIAKVNKALAAQGREYRIGVTEIRSTIGSVGFAQDYLCEERTVRLSGVVMVSGCFALVASGALLVALLPVKAGRRG